MNSLIAAISRPRRHTSSGGFTPIPTTITITGDTSGVATHDTNPYVAVVKDQYGTPHVEWVPTYHSSVPGVATIDGTTGVATAIAAGDTSITATYGGVTSAVPVALHIADQAPNTVVMTPSSASIPDNGSTTISATFYDQANPANPIAGAPVQWSSGAPSKATVNQNTGVVTGAGAGAGSTVITATSGGVSGTATVTVTAAASQVNSVTVSPSSVSVQIGATQQMTATVKDQYGTVMPTQGVSWGSNDATKATVDANTGVVTGVAIGSVTITATSLTNGSKTGTATISVLSPQAWLFNSATDTYILDTRAGGRDDMQVVGSPSNTPAQNLALFKALWPDKLNQVSGGSQTNGGTNNFAFLVDCDGNGTHATQHVYIGSSYRTLAQNITADPVNPQTVLVSSTGGFLTNHPLGIGWDPVTQTAKEAVTCTVNSATTMTGVFTQNHTAGEAIMFGNDYTPNQIQASLYPGYSNGRITTPVRHFILSYAMYQGRFAADNSAGAQGSTGAFSNFNLSISAGGQQFRMTKDQGGGGKHALVSRSIYRAVATNYNRVGNYWDSGIGGPTGFNRTRLETDQQPWNGIINGTTYGLTNSSTISQNPVDPNLNFIGKWVTFYHEFKADDSAGDPSGIVRTWVDYGQANAPTLIEGWNGSGSGISVGTEAWDAIQLLSTMNTPLIPMTAYLKDFVIFARDWNGPVPPAQRGAPTLASHTAGSATFNIPIPSSNCDTVRFYSTLGGIDAQGKIQGNNLNIGPYTFINDTSVSPGELGTTKQVTVPVTPGKVTFLAYSLGNSGAFGEPSAGYSENNPQVSTVPDAPSASNATSVTGNSASFPVTLAATGSAPSLITPEFDTTGSGNWVAQADVAVTVAQGQAQAVTVTGLSASTTYTNRFRFRAKNAAGSSSPSATVSGTTTGQALSVTGGNFTLINKGHQVLSITDGTNAVAGCTISSSDTSKVDVYSGYTVVGKADSGSVTLTISHAGYTNTTVTVTCSALDLVETGSAGTSTTTNGAANTSWTDQSPTGVVYSEATNPPTYTASSVNSLPGLTFNGTTSRLQSPGAVAALNGAACSVFAIIKPSASGDSRASGRQFLGNLNNSTSRGFFLSLNSSNQVTLTLGTGTASAVVASSTTYTGGNPLKVVALLATGNQTLRVGGAQVQTGTNPYAPNTSTSPSSLGCNYAGTGNFLPGDAVNLFASARLWTAQEYQQLEQYSTDVYGV